MIKMPDLKARDKKSNGEIFTEVKRMRRSEEEEKESREKKVFASFQNSNFEISIKNKIKYFLNDALEKFDKVKARTKKERILIIDFSKGIDVMLTKSPEDRNLLGILGKDYFNKLTNQNSIQIWTHKYFED